MGLIRPISVPRALASLNVCNHFQKKGGGIIILISLVFLPLPELGVKFPFISVVKISICPLPGVERKELPVNFWISNLTLPLRTTK